VILPRYLHKTVSKAWTSSLKRRIEQLTTLSTSLKGCIGCGCLTMGECPWLNPQDLLGESNSGPVIFDQTIDKTLDT
jgi:MerR family redox-sensitive transcriptional activator SoxR